MRNFLRLRDFSLNDAEAVMTRAAHYKAGRLKTGAERPLEGQSWGLIFSKSSTRTRVSFETGIYEMGGRPMFLSPQDIQLGRGEPVRDTGRVLGRMIHGLIVRTYDQQDLDDLAAFSGIPTINALTDEEHPCQILTDIFTYQEKRGSIRDKTVAFIGDAACNVACSWVHAAEMFGFNLVCAAPDGYQSPIANTRTRLVSDPLEAAQGADLLYTDVWVSMGKEDEAAERIERFQGFQINHELLAVAAPDALVLHCLPAYRGKEITNEILEERADDIFDQAENRLHVQKAIIHHLVTTDSPL